MPWKESDEMEERMKFVVEALARGANISDICRNYGISRTLGYKMLKRYEQEGLPGLYPRSKRPHSFPGAISPEMVCEIVKEREGHPRWGGLTLRTRLLSRFEAKSVPSIRTIERVLERCDLVKKRRKRVRRDLPDGIIKKAKAPNEVWTVDFKGEWRMRNGSYCFPLTIRDEYSRYILDISALSGPGYERTKERFEACFEKYGLPQFIRSDNGTPFASVRSLGGLTRLSAWWLKLGIFPNRIPPRSPHLNGAHERMHLDMSKELQISPQKKLKDEQLRFDQWRQEYNCVRPHRALNQKTPNDIYRKSKRFYTGNVAEFKYPKIMEVRKVCGHRGNLVWGGNRRFLSNSIKGEYVGIKQEPDEMISVWFCEMLLGETDSKLRAPFKR